MTEEQARQYVNDWQERLGLSVWTELLKRYG